MLYCAVYSSKILRPVSDNDIIRLFKKAQRLNKKHHLTGCLIHHKDEFLHFVEGNRESIDEIYVRRGIDDCIRHASPLFEESKKKPIFEYPYVVSDSLWQQPGGAAIPVLNNAFLFLLRETLGNKTLALRFFWQCVDDIIVPADTVNFPAITPLPHAVSKKLTGK